MLGHERESSRRQVFSAEEFLGGGFDPAEDPVGTGEGAGAVAGSETSAGAGAVAGSETSAGAGAVAGSETSAGAGAVAGTGTVEGAETLEDWEAPRPGTPWNPRRRPGGWIGRASGFAAVALVAAALAALVAHALFDRGAQPGAPLAAPATTGTAGARPLGTPQLGARRLESAPAVTREPARERSGGARPVRENAPPTARPASELGARDGAAPTDAPTDAVAGPDAPPAQAGAPRSTGDVSATPEFGFER